MTALRVAAGVVFVLSANAADAGDTRLVDERGYIDVWQLRRDVAAVEALEVGSCYPSADPDAAQRERQILTCAERTRQRFRGYREGMARVNRQWQPAIASAIERGDPVAEVIMRRCDTTAVLDRRSMETTCEDDRARRATATRRLREIGFAPAFDLFGEAMLASSNAGVPSRRDAARRFVALIGEGMLGFDALTGYHGGNAPADADERDHILNAELIQAARYDMLRAFTAAPAIWQSTWQAGISSELRLNRRATMPDALTWGPRIPAAESDGSPMWFWHDGPRTIHLQYGTNEEQQIAGPGDREFTGRLERLLADAESSIERHLQRDPRWGVFLLERVGWHEWVPHGTASASGELSVEWAGEWTLRRTYSNWTLDDDASPLTALIRIDGAASWLDIQRPATDDARAEAEHCRLRYSGGTTWIPGQTGDVTLTVLGNLETIGMQPAQGGGTGAAFDPLDPTQRYRQVLVQCPQGEWPGIGRVRFLLLAGDTLIKVHRDAQLRPSGVVPPLIVRQFRRAGA